MTTTTDPVAAFRKAMPDRPLRILLEALPNDQFVRQIHRAIARGYTPQAVAAKLTNGVHRYDTTSAARLMVWRLARAAGENEREVRD